MPNSPIKILALGGLGEIGMNCLVLESAHEMIAIDCGVMFSDLDHFGVEYVIPDFTYLVERKDKFKGFWITHGHEDHIGSLAYAIKAGLHAPIYASPLTALMIQERLREHGLEDKVQIKVVEPNVEAGHTFFRITPTPVTHSIVETCALLIHTPEGLIIHTGDFKIDPDPVYGNPIDESVFKKCGDKGVLLLLSDSTNVERCEHGQSEGTLYEKFERAFSEMNGLCMVAMFSSNIGRMSQVMKLAKKMGKKVALAGRSMEQNVRLAQQQGYLKDALEVIIPLTEAERVKREKLIVLCGGTQAEPGSALSRAAYGDHTQIKLAEGDKVILSSRHIPGNEKGISRMINEVYRRGADVLYDAVEDIHVSGHASKPELEKMLKWTRPKFFVPIHGEYRHLIHHAKLAETMGVKKGHVLVMQNGDLAGLSKSSIKHLSEMEEQPRILIEGGSLAPVPKRLLKDRRKLAEKGVISAVVTRDWRTGKVIQGPELIAKGVASESVEEFLLEEAKERVLEVIKRYHKNLKNRGPKVDLAEEIRLEIRRFVNANLGKKPVVLSQITDID